MDDVSLKGRASTAVSLAYGGIGFALLGLIAIVGAIARRRGGTDLDASGVHLVLDSLFNVAAAWMLLSLCIGVGGRALRLIGVEVRRPCDEVVFGTTCGLGIVAAVLLFCCVCFGVNGFSIVVAVVGLACASWSEIKSSSTLVVNSVMELLGAHESRRVSRVAAIGFGLVVFALVGLASTPPVDWDTLAYHLEIPREWLQVGRLVLPADNYHLAFVGLQHFLYLPLLAMGSVSGPAVLNVFLAIIAGLATYSLASETNGRRTGVIGHWLFWASPLVLLVAVTPRTDVTLVLYFVATLLALCRVVYLRAGRRMLLLAASLVGLGVGVKFVALAFIPALLPAFAIGAVLTARGERRRLGPLVARLTAAMLLAATPWLVKNWLLIGPPFYPFLSHLRLEPWMEPLYSTQYVPGDLARAVANPLAEIRIPFNLVDLFFHPWRLMADPGNQYSAPTLALWLLPLGVLLPRKRVAAFLAVPALIFAFVVLLQSRETNLRYLLPALPPLLIVVAAVMDYATRLSRRGGNVLVAILLAILLAPTAVAVAARVRESPTLAFLLGRVSRRDYLEHYWETGSYMPVVEWADQHLPRSSMTLALFEPRKFYFDVPMRSDVAVRNWPLVEPFAHAPGCLREAGITHVLVNDAAVEFYEMRGMHLDRMRWASFERYREECLQLLFTNGAFRVFAIRTVQPAASSSAHPRDTQ